ncbi:Plant specific eukaryotic initiation factor 4B [Macleaya cordata]|uniref:Plant specific eukaryotic initiation factor 4B n=1 Tax=Macleaya cordata TaxID=56857 RepID=A0A200Q7G0_MACCD|nr:Plant specific eukaryotic initiation factor 4B [Macleaya cordata]
MATTVSAWAKPGAWALDSEENEAELIQQEKERENSSNGHLDYLHHQKQQQEQQPLADFPSLSTAVATKSKKKKAAPISLSEFTTGKSVSHGSARAAAQTTTTQAKGLTADELRVLPTGPRERTAEELERSSTRLGGGFRSYGTNSRYSNGGDDSSSNRDRWGSDESRGRGGGGGFNRENNRESAPSRADEIDDWGAAKKSMAAPAFERRERGGGFFDSQSRADESDSWVSNKSRVASSMPPRRVGGGGGFENPRERRGGFELFQKETSNGGGADSDTWGKKREEGSPTVTGARPRLVLQPRTISPSNGEQQQQPGSGSGSNTKSKGSNPFGEARPREEVLAEKGQDWKKIDEQLESVKIKETDGSSSLGKKSFGNGNGRVTTPENRTERSWRKPESVDVPPSPSAEIAAEDGGVVAAES